MEICCTLKCKVVKYWIDSENYMEDFAHKMSYLPDYAAYLFYYTTVFSKITIKNESRMTVMTWLLFCMQSYVCVLLMKKFP